MREVIEAVLLDIKEHLERVGIHDWPKAIDVENDKQAAVYDQLVKIKKLEVADYAATWMLRTPETWAYYEGRGSTLPEMKLLRAAARKLNQAWRARVAIFWREEEHGTQDSKRRRGAGSANQEGNQAGS